MHLLVFLSIITTQPSNDQLLFQELWKIIAPIVNHQSGSLSNLGLQWPLAVKTFIALRAVARLQRCFLSRAGIQAGGQQGSSDGPSRSRHWQWTTQSLQGSSTTDRFTAGAEQRRHVNASQQRTSKEPLRMTFAETMTWRCCRQTEQMWSTVQWNVLDSSRRGWPRPLRKAHIKASRIWKGFLTVVTRDFAWNI